MSEAAVKRSDLANFDPDTPLEKLGWAREEMQRNFQQPARAMRVCTVCSERWDTAEDGGVITGGWCIACHGSTAQQQSAFTLEYIVPYSRSVRDVPTLKMRVVLFLVCIKNSTITSKHDHCRILVHVACFFFLGWDESSPFLGMYQKQHHQQQA